MMVADLLAYAFGAFLGFIFIVALGESPKRAARITLITWVACAALTLLGIL